MTPVTVAVSTLGCRLNQVESQELIGLLERHGFRAAAEGERAQVHVVNTCTVTGRADFSDRQLVRRITRENPDALVVVTGCYAQTDPQARGPHPRRRPRARQPGEVPARRSAPLARQAPARPTCWSATSPRRAACRWRLTRACPGARAPPSRSRTAASIAAPSASCPRRAAEPEPGSQGGARAGGEPRGGRLPRRHPHRRRHRPLRLRSRCRAPRSPRWPRGSSEVPGLRWLRLSSVLPAYFTPRAPRGRHRIGGDRPASAPAAPERERPGASG